MSDYNCWSGIIKDIDDLKAEIQQLKEENKMLRECVELIADKKWLNEVHIFAKQTLAKIKGEQK